MVSGIDGDERPAEDRQRGVRQRVRACRAGEDLEAAGEVGCGSRHARLQRCPQIRERHHQRHRLKRRFRKTEREVERLRLVRNGMD